MRRLVPAALAVASVAVSFGVSPAPASAARSAMPYDFDGNGHPDLVVSAPTKQIDGARSAGAVVVLPASAAGVSLRNTLISQASAGVPGAPEAGDGFGTAVASADFDRDGLADLAIGAPAESIGTLSNAGAVTVVYGSAAGLDTARRSLTFNRPGGSVREAFCGSSLVAGDFDADGYPDLAIGCPGDVRSQTDPASAVGSVNIFFGGIDGLSPAGARVLGPQVGVVAEFDAFGAKLAAGDLDGDGDTDLVVGASGHEVGDEGYVNGSVSYCSGQRGGPDRCRRLVGGDDFALADQIAVGNMSGSSLPEIVVGESYSRPRDGEGSSAAERAGKVIILDLRTGSPLTVAGQRTLRQSSVGVPGGDESSDVFGYSVELGDLDRDGYADLVVGAPGENGYRGRVTVVHGAAAGWRTSGNCTYSQDTRGVPGTAEAYDQFGVALSLLDHDGDGRLDLTVGANGENRSGAVTTLRGASGCGFTSMGSRTFGLSTLGYSERLGASFGSALGRSA